MTYTIAASGGCPAFSATTVVTVSAAPNANIAYQGGPFCLNDNNNPMVTQTGTSGGSYSSSSGLSINSTTGEIDLSNTTAGNYTVSYTIPAASGCPVFQTQTNVLILSLPNININGANAICNGNTTTLTAIGASTYIWSNGETTASISVSPTSNTSYSVTGTQSGCTNIANYNINVNNPPQIQISGNDTICSGGSTQISATGATTYIWEDGSTLANRTVFPITSTTYTVTGTMNGCSEISNIRVVVLDSPTLSLNLTQPDCAQENGIIEAIVSGGTGNYTFEWSNGYSGRINSQLPHGQYMVTVSDGACSTMGNANLIDPNLALTAKMYITPRVTNILDGHVQFYDMSIGDIVSWEWDFGDGNFAQGINTQHQFSAIGTHFITHTVRSESGCVASITDSIIVTDVFTIYIPNAFTPDDNYTNNDFYATGIGVNTEGFSMMIFDRWGGEVFRTNQWQNNRSYPAWNGRKNNNGEVLPIGSYAYIVYLKDLNGKEYKKVGNVLIIK